MKRFTEKLEGGRNILRKGYRSCVEYGFVNYVENFMELIGGKDEKATTKMLSS